MFDGIHTLVLPARDTARLAELYTGPFGFEVASRQTIDDPGWARLWGLPARPTRSTLLVKPGSRGGHIRLVDVADLPDPPPAAQPDRPGAYALDFYLRTPAATEQRLAELGWTFRSEAVHYQLPGTGAPVRERMLEQTTSGLVHALVGYRPRGTRCVLDDDLEAHVSEVGTAVFVTDRFAEAVRFGQGVLGGQLYFDDWFGGPQVEHMLGLAPGRRLRAAMFRGPQSLNARLEFLDAGPDARPAADKVPRVIPSLVVDSLPRLAERLADGRHGASTGVLELRMGDRVEHKLGLTSIYGTQFEFSTADGGCRR